MHAHIRKRDLVDKLFHLGFYISYDRILRLPVYADHASVCSLCRRFEQEQVVCPMEIRNHFFTTAAADNINPSSETVSDSLHAARMSLFQPLKADNVRQFRDIVVIETSATSKAIDIYKNRIQLSRLWFSCYLLPKYHLDQNGDLIENGLSLLNAF